MTDGALNSFDSQRVANELVSTINEQRELAIFQALKPIVGAQNGKWYIHYGEHPNNIFAQGDTLSSAVSDFANKYYNQKAKP